MNKIISNIKSLDIITQIILGLIVLFIPTAIVPYFIVDALALSADYSQLIDKPWTLITYSFIHEKFIHLFSNVLVLYYIGNIFLNFFSIKMLKVYFIIGSIMGGIFYLIYVQFFPSLQQSVLLGASASVTSLLLGITAKVPHYGLNFRFLGRIELWVLSSIWVVLSILATGGFQAGAAVAHLGGGIAGYILTLGIQSDKSKRKTKSKLKQVYRNPNAPNVIMSASNKRLNDKQVNDILDKISKSGYETLSTEEKDFLFNQKE